LKDRVLLHLGIYLKSRAKIVLNQEFGYWKVIETSSEKYVQCLCTACNTQHAVYRYNLINNQTKSCGCKKYEHIKQSFKDRYGVENPSQIPETREKVKKTNLEKYGNEFFMKTEKFKSAQAQAWDMKFSGHPMRDEQVKQKYEETNISRYGSDYKLKQATKMKEAITKKYGVENPSQLKEIKEQKKQTSLINFGLEHHLQLPSKRNILRDWCNENPHKLYKSKPELELLTWIQQHFPSASKYKVQGNEADIFIPELKLGIEHNGLYRHSELFKENNYHLNKTTYFKGQGIRIIHIWSHEWLNKEKQVKSFLLSAINKNEHKIGARKCKVVWSNSKEEIKKAHDLLDSTHIQGHTNSTKYAANVYYNNELLATATFGKHHRNSKTWVLSRFTTKTNYTIQGILSKISKLASKELKSDIVSWADYRLSTGNGYEKAGWKFEELLKPDYFYTKLNDTRKIMSKQSRQKKLVNTPKNMTEHEHALQDGLLRIYDCGKIRYKYPYILI
jgi:hypothetical protein